MIRRKATSADTPALCPHPRRLSSMATTTIPGARGQAQGLANHHDAGSATIAICRVPGPAKRPGRRRQVPFYGQARCSAPPRRRWWLTDDFNVSYLNQAYLGHAMRSSIQSQRHSRHPSPSAPHHSIPGTHLATADDMPHPPYASALDDARLDDDIDSTNSRPLQCPKPLPSCVVRRGRRCALRGGERQLRHPAACGTGLLERTGHACTGAERRIGTTCAKSDGAAGAAAAAQDNGDRVGMGCESERVEAVAGSDRRYRRELRFVQQQPPCHPPPFHFDGIRAIRTFRSTAMLDRRPSPSVEPTALRCALGDDDKARCSSPREASLVAGGRFQHLLSNFNGVRVIQTHRPRVIQFAGTEPPPTTSRRGSAAATPAVFTRPRRRSSMTTASAGAKDVASQPKVGWTIDKEGRTRRQRDRNDESVCTATQTIVRHLRACAPHPCPSFSTPTTTHRPPTFFLQSRSSWMAACPRTSRQ
ncbi:hypothetical protein BJ912DRAFT_464454 [Pholiota molesta]|nr:hypothetical protein BJ912DRAFT_464454 [Pholiota molesta]